MIMEHWKNENDRENRRIRREPRTGANVHHVLYKEEPGIEPQLLRREAGD